MARSAYSNILFLLCQKLKIPTRIAMAMIQVESGGNPYAWNPEPRYRYLVDARTSKPFRKLTRDEARAKMPPKDFPTCPDIYEDQDAEWWGQQASWGLLQVMGAVAREYGFKRHFPALCDPEEGLEYGLQHFARLRDRFIVTDGWDGVIAAYNAGSPRRDDEGLFVNQRYLEKVLSAGNMGSTANTILPGKPI